MADPITRQLVVMVKEPVPGRIKSRLARETSTLFATCWYRRQMCRLIHCLARDRRWTTHLAIAPDRACSLSRIWPDHLHRIPQGTGTLSHRIRRVFQSMPPGPVIVIGSDIPGILPDHIFDAFRMLGRHRVVIGPSDDGGYWLIGLRRLQSLPRHGLSGVRWSTCHALEDTVQSFSPHRAAITVRLNDVDTLSDITGANQGTPLPRRASHPV